MSTATLSRPTTTDLLERHTTTVNPVDREGGVLHHVKILGAESLNGRVYSPAAMRDAAKLYENAVVNIGHPSPHDPRAERSMSERFGILKNISIEPDGIFGDLHFNRSSVHANYICEAAERFPTTISLSHNATGEGNRRGGVFYVERVTDVVSVDVVTDGATTNSLFEERGHGMTDTRSNMI